MAVLSDDQAETPATGSDGRADSSTPAGGREIEELAALAEVIGENAGDVVELGAACAARLRAAEAALKSAGRFEPLPLIIELAAALDAAGDKPSHAVCAAVSAGMGLLAHELGGQTASPSRRQEIAAITELRSARGAQPLWRNALVDVSIAPENEAGDEQSTDVDVSELARVGAKTLSAFRKSLLMLLKTGAPGEAKVLAGLSQGVARACARGAEQRLWQSAADFFAAVGASRQSGRPVVKRFAARLEGALRSLAENAPLDGRACQAMAEDLETLGRLFAATDPGEEVTSGAEAELPLSVNADRLAEAIQDLAGSTPAEPGLLIAVADAFLIQGDCPRWLEARELAAARAPAEALTAAANRWAGAPETAVAESPSAELDGAEEIAVDATLRKLDGALGGDDDKAVEPAAALAGIPVDEALLDNLNVMAAEIRGARSRAEAKLGTLRGGLLDMERTIKTLRAQLEALEVDSTAPPAERPEAEAEHGVQDRLGALSRGIEELAGLKDALQALTEETETALATQAGGNTQLEEDLLKTRMTPVGRQFERWSAHVARVAADLAVRPTLIARGAEVALERGQVEKLNHALEPLLEACVRDGINATPGGAQGAVGDARLELNVSRPRFDVCVELGYRGAPLSPAAFSSVRRALKTLGATCAGEAGDHGHARLRLMLPGPPKPMDVLLVAVGKDRYALPVNLVSGVSRPPREAFASGAGEGLMTFEGDQFPLKSLASALGAASTLAQRNACVLVTVGAARYACLVDGVIGRDHVLVQSPGPLLCANPWVLGVVVDALAAPTLVLDMRALESEASNAPA